MTITETTSARTEQRAVWEYECEPFTVAEGAALDEYDSALDGVRESLAWVREAGDAAQFLRSSVDQDVTEVLAASAEYTAHLNTWYLALDSLIAGLLTCTSERTFYSTAAARCLKAQAAEYHEHRTGFEYAVTVAALGVDNTVMGNYPSPTRSLDLAMHSLSCEAA
ncbi:hypothetical protein [Streptomyces sp. cg36]|uniref:hypothetical protein n=1 Tax=Streptomyces sp. cg36 TaxID=3238798 RepID=UPI0034E23632